MIDAPPPFDELWFKIVMGIIVGLALGSFVTMLSYRLPRRLSIIKPGSFCPVCKTPLQVRDLVPVGSWVCSGGQCSHCGTKISVRYPLIELATALLSAIAFFVIGFQPLLVIALSLIVLGITLIVIQIEKRYS